MSKAVEHEGVVYFCGQTAKGSSAHTIQEQTAEVLSRVDAMLEQVGSSRTHLLVVTIHLRSIEDFSAMNEVWEAWLPAGAAPARTTVQALLASATLLVEMSVIAAVEAPGTH